MGIKSNAKSHPDRNIIIIVLLMIFFHVEDRCVYLFGQSNYEILRRGWNSVDSEQNFLFLHVNL